MVLVPTNARDTDRLLDLLFEHARVGLCLAAPDGTVVRANDEWLRSTGVAGQAIADSILDLLLERGDSGTLHERVGAGETIQLPRHVQLADGPAACWERSVLPVPMNGGSGFLITAREVTGEVARGSATGSERARAEEALASERLARERAELLASMAEELNRGAALDAVLRAAVERGTELLGGDDGVLLLLEPDGRHVRVRSEKWKLGRTGTVLDLESMPASRSAVTDLMTRFVTRAQAAGANLEWLKRLGAWGCLVVPIFVQGQRLGILYVAYCVEGHRPSRPDLDFAEAIANQIALTITRARTFEALRRSEERFRTLAENAPDVITRFDRAMRHLYANPALGRVTGIPTTHIIGKRNSELDLAPELVARWEAHLMRVFETGEPGTLEFVFDGPHGMGHYEARLVPELEDDRVASVLVVTRDMTERKRGEQALREAEGRARAQAAELEAVLDAVPAAVCITRDREGGHIEGNNLCRELLRLPPTVNVSGTARPGEHPEKVRAMKNGVEIPVHELPVQVAAARGVEVRNQEFDLVFEDGTTRHVLGNSAPLRDDLGNPRGAVGAFVDITERKRGEDALKRSQATLAQAGEMARLGAWWLEISDHHDLDACPVHWSDEVYRIYGYAPGEVEVTNAFFFERVHPEDRRRVEKAVALAMLEKQPYRVEHRIIKPGGEERVVLEHAEIVFDERGLPQRMIGAVQDITEQKRAEEALREADRRKNEFLGVLSHELRNPLAPIRSALFILDRAQPGGDQAARAKEVIERQMEHLTRLVDDLLDVTRISRGKIQLQRTRVDVAEIVRGTVEDHRGLFAEHEVDVVVRDSDRPLWIDGDGTRLAQIIGNLLVNAAKFTGVRGRVEIFAAAERGQVVVTVRDTGVGITPQLLGRVFEPFIQADDSLHRSRGGLGLGLALVKGLVELHGGTVEARSEGVGRGAEFTVRFPLLADTVRERAPCEEAGAAAPGRRVLIVEDNLDAAETLCVMLEMCGHEVAVAHDGRAGVEKVRAFRPDVVLCDIGLPEMDGYDVARAIRADDSLRRTALVALTGYALPDDQRRAAEAGFDHHLAKPVTSDEILQVLAAVSPLERGATAAGPRRAR
jgi:PAS domain S-box-containing protein